MYVYFTWTNGNGHRTFVFLRGEVISFSSTLAKYRHHYLLYTINNVFWTMCKNNKACNNNYVENVVYHLSVSRILSFHLQINKLT